MKNPEFVHLHVHSSFSLLDGACRPEALAQTVLDYKMPAVALTDHGNLFGAIKFYETMKEFGVKPLIGYEAYVAPGDCRKKEASSASDAATHLTLLAMNDHGYRNIVKLASIAYLEGFYYKPRVDYELLKKYSDGVICLSGCLSSRLSRLLVAGDYQSAKKLAEFHRELWGADRFYIEMQDNGLEEQRRILKDLARLCKDLDLKPVATNDAHYIKAEDAAFHEALLCINTGSSINSDKRMRLGSNEFYIKSPREMYERFKWIPDALMNTIEVAERCNAEIPLGQHHFPVFSPEDGRSSERMLRDLCEDGLIERYDEITDEIRNRLEYELDVIIRMQYAAYFLIVWDIVNFARKRGIPHGLRGSGGGSMVSYVLHISDTEPLRHGLLFERFLDPQRKEVPDLDLDFCEVRREEVINYVKEKYGDDRTAQIITFGTMAARGVVRDVGRALEIPLPEVEQITRLIPLGPKVKLKETLESEQELRQLYEKEPRIRKLIDYALKLEGLPRHSSTHPAGVVMADQPLQEYIPLISANGVISSQFDMEDIDKVGMLKMDLLGLRTLTIVDRTLDMVKAKTGKKPEMNDIPLGDEKTYEFLATRDTGSVFQLSSQGIQELLRRLKPQDIEDLTAVVGLYRPGPLRAGVVDSYIKRKHGEEEIGYPHPSLEPILNNTYGLIVYQEQIMRIAHEVAGMELGDALTMIKAISKKKDEIIQERRERFIEGAIKNGLTKEAAEAVFDHISKFAEYGFNKAHTTAYSYLSYRTAYLKAHYPVEFMAAVMTCEMQFSDKITRHREECRKMGVNLLGPSINESYPYFTVAGDDSIRFGLGAIRNAGVKAMDEVVNARDRIGNFKSLYHFCDEVDLQKVNRQTIESLIKAGAFDCVPGHRAQKLAALDDAIRIGGRAQRDRKSGQGSFLDAMGGDSGEEHHLPEVPEWPPTQMLECEKEALGFYISGHPLDEDAHTLKLFATATGKTFGGREGGAWVVMGGMIRNLKFSYDKRGQNMAMFEIEDLEGVIRCVVFSSNYEQCSRFLVDQAKVFITGKADSKTDNPSVLVDAIIPISEAYRKFCGAVRIALDPSDSIRETYLGIKDILAKHSGGIPVYIDMPGVNGDRAIINVSKDLYVTPTGEFAAEIGQLIGEGKTFMLPSKNFIDAKNGNGKSNSNNGGRYKKWQGN